MSPEPKDWFESKAQVQLFRELDYACVYLLGPPQGRPLRLGASRKPWTRIAVLQDAHWQPLTIHTILWLAGAPLAQRVEREAARLMDTRRLTNQWYDITPEWAMRSLEVAARNLGLSTLSHAAMVSGVKAMHSRRLDRQVAALS